MVEEPAPTAPTAPAEETVDEVLAALEARISPVSMKQTRGKFFFYGPPGSGKTVLAAQAPKPLIVDVERGTLSINNHKDSIDTDNVAVLEYKSFRQLELLIKKLNEGAFPEIETVIIDSMSELHKRGLQEITEREWRNGNGRNKDGVKRNRYVPETEDHTENNEHIRRLTSSLRDLNRNLVVISHHRTKDGKDGGLAAIYPDFSEKLANTLMGIFDAIGYLSIERKNQQEVRTLRVRTDGKIACKTRLGALPDVIEDPTWDVLWDAVLKQAESDKREVSSDTESDLENADEV